MLLVDTCGAEGGVAVAALAPDGPRVLSQSFLPGRETQERLMIALAGVLAEAGMTAGELDVLAVITGPGSFTGVRIGLAAVKGLAESLGKPVIAISRLAVLAAQAKAPQGTVVQAWLDAGRGDVFVGRYRDGAMLRETMLHGDDAQAALQPEDVVVVLEDSVAARVPHALRAVAAGAQEALPLAALAAARGAFADIALLDANYLRVPDAELARLRAVATA